jgi:hypothetical protein
MRLFALTAVLPVVLAAQTATDADWSFAHPDATLVGAIKPRAILDSPLLTFVTEDLGMADVNTKLMMGLVRATLGSVNEIRFSLQDNGTKEPDVIALVSGSFDEGLLSALAQQKAKVRRIDANTILLGNGPSLDKAAARVARTGASLRPRVSLVSEAMEASDFWLSGQLPEMPMTAQLRTMLRGLALGLTVRDDLAAAFDLHAANAEQAQALVRETHSAEAKMPPLYQGLLQSYVDGNTAHFRITVPRQILLDAVKNRAIPGMPGQEQPRLERLAPPLLEAPAQPKKVVIQGLDSGPREIPLQ